MRAAERNQRVTFQRNTTTSDTQGGRAASWANIAGLVSVAASVEWDTGEEAQRSDQLVAQRRGTLRTRYSTVFATVTEKDRIVWNSRTLAIVAIRPGGQRLREWIDFAVVERAS